ncbi:MAG TPA: DUF992 domain-containing protein [Gammaproteobacteria bacterium]|nr:DUF992 domain-containing protein [Gammaproteobacteria bacterium]
MKAFNLESVLFLLATLVLASTPFSVVHADNGKGKIGIVTCDYVPGSKVNLLIHSTAAFDCVFEHGGEKDYYDGEAGIALGLDLQWTDQSTMAYTVMASTGKDRDWSEALTGTYTGGKASAAFGAGVGAAVLIGGGNDSIGLVPLALEGGTGLGATAGLGYLSLKAR